MLTPQVPSHDLLLLFDRTRCRRPQEDQQNVLQTHAWGEKQSLWAGLAAAFSLILECCLKTRRTIGGKKMNQSFLFLTTLLCAKEM